MLSHIVTGVDLNFKAKIPQTAVIFLCLFVLSNSILAQTPAENDTEMEAKLKRQEEGVSKNMEKCRELTESVYSTSYKPNTTRPRCPIAFDHILCWGEAPANTTARQQCPDYVIGFVNPRAYAERICLPNGTWATKLNKNHQRVEYTNYKECMVDDDGKIYAIHLPKVKLISKIGSSISLTSLVLAILILSGLKRLHCARNILHINLFASFLLFSIMQLIKEFLWVSSLGFSKDVIPIDDGSRFIMNENVSHWECKIFMSIYKYAESTEHAMIFSEALYLNTLVSLSTFNEKNHYKFYIALGWLAPLLWLIPYVAVLSYNIHNSCWTEQTYYSFIQVVPQCILILANFGLFINIVRILFIKLKTGQMDSREYRYKKLAKSTLILLPLFGIYYIMFNVWQPFVNGKLSVTLELARLYFDIVCNSFQGLIISLIYVFFNSEVRNEIIKIIERVLLRRNPNMRRFSKFSTPPNRERSISLNERNIVARQSSKPPKKSLTSSKSIVSTTKNNRTHLDSMRTQEASSVAVSEANSMYLDESKLRLDSKNNSTNHVNGYDFANKLLLEKNRKSSGKKFSIFNWFRRFKASSETSNHLKSTSPSIVSRPTLRVDSIDVHEIKLKVKRNSKKVKLRPPSEPSVEDDANDTLEPNGYKSDKTANESDAPPVVKIVVNGDMPHQENESNGNDSAFDESSNLLQTSDEIANDYHGEDDQEHPLFLKHLKLNLGSLDYIDEAGRHIDKQESVKSKVNSIETSLPSVKPTNDAESKSPRDFDQAKPPGDPKARV